MFELKSGIDLAHLINYWLLDNETLFIVVKNPQNFDKISVPNFRKEF